MNTEKESKANQPIFLMDCEKRSVYSRKEGDTSYSVDENLEIVILDKQHKHLFKWDKELENYTSIGYLGT